MPKAHITKEQYDEIEERANAAREFLEDERFEFIRDYISNSTDSIEQSVLNNTVRDVEESVTITDRIVRTFKTPKKVQIDELSGQYQWLTKFIEDMQYYANELEDLEAKVEAGDVIID